MGQAKRIVIAVAAAAALAGCEETYTNHGFAPQVQDLAAVSAGSDTRGSVLRKLGRPSSISSFDSNFWIYEASRVEKYAFYAPKVIERTVVAVNFDEQGLVSDVARYGVEDGQIVNLVTRLSQSKGARLVPGSFGRLGRSPILGQVIHA